MMEPGVQLKFMLISQRQQWDNMRERMGIGYNTHHLTREQKVEILQGHLDEFQGKIVKLEHPCTIFWFPNHEQCMAFQLTWWC